MKLLGLRFGHVWVPVASGAALLAAACGGSSAPGDAPAANPQDGGTVSGHGMSGMMDGGMTGGSPATGDAVLIPDARDTVTAVARDNYIVFRKMRINARQRVTVRFENQGQAVHDFTVHGAGGAAMRDAAGKQIKTSLVEGGASTEVRFAIAQPGTYEIMCDVHPEQVRAVLRVR